MGWEGEAGAGGGGNCVTFGRMRKRGSGQAPSGGRWFSFTESAIRKKSQNNLKNICKKRDPGRGLTGGTGAILLAAGCSLSSGARTRSRGEREGAEYHRACPEGGFT